MNSANGATFLICYFRQELYIASRKNPLFSILKIVLPGKTYAQYERRKQDFHLEVVIHAAYLTLLWHTHTKKKVDIVSIYFWVSVLSEPRIYDILQDSGASSDSYRAGFKMAGISSYQMTAFATEKMLKLSFYPLNMNIRDTFRLQL